LRNSYQLDDNFIRILISSRLKKRAFTWFYSKAEYLTLNNEDLLEEIKQMFDLRPGNCRLEKSSRPMEGRRTILTIHEKVILVNRVSIAEDELLNYLIEGLVDMRLQNQARIMNFRSRTDS